MKKVLLGLFLILFLSVITAPAQIMSNPAQWYINNSMYSTRVFNGMVANSMLRKGARGKTSRKTAGAVKSASDKTAVDHTIFRQAATNSLPKLLAAKSGAQQRQAEQFFDSLIDLYRQTASKDGFPANDLAYAFEYFVVNNYQIYHDLVNVEYEKDPRARRGRDGFDRIEIINQKKLLQVTISQERAIYNQFKTMLAANPEVQKMTDAQKQEAAELFAIMFGVGYTGYMSGIDKEDETLTEQARQMAKDGLEKLLGVSVEQIKITDNGLEL